MSPQTASLPRHPIGVVSRRTGLKPPVIRAWERRYGAIEPERDDNGHRLYSDEHIERLLLLREATQGGWSIGQVAEMPNRDLEDLISPHEGFGFGRRSVATTPTPSPPATTQPPPPSPPPPARSPSGAAQERGDRRTEGGSGDGLAGDPDRDSMAESILGICLSALRRLDAPGLETQLERSLGSLSRRALLEQVLVPFLAAVGQRWRDGTLRQVHEHLAYASVRSFLGRLGRERTGSDAPRLVLATPSGQYHELGTLLAAALASAEGWHATYFGPSLSPEDIASVARASGARAVALGLTYPPDDALLTDELGRLADALGDGTALILGGRAAPSYGAALGDRGGRVVVTRDLPALRRVLSDLS